jgi:GntR family transcriptional repressor for pyruvate dehydrogenase complex
LLRQHLSIADGILRGDPKSSEKAASDHIHFTFQTIEEIRRDEERIEVSLRRVSRSDLLADQ